METVNNQILMYPVPLHFSFGSIVSQCGSSYCENTAPDIVHLFNLASEEVHPASRSKNTK